MERRSATSESRVEAEKGRPEPAFSRSTTAAQIGWSSIESQRINVGIPARMPAAVVPAPPWWTTARQAGKTAEWFTAPTALDVPNPHYDKDFEAAYVVIAAALPGVHAWVDEQLATKGVVNHGNTTQNAAGATSAAGAPTANAPTPNSNRRHSCRATPGGSRGH
jgi:hypothetical protein